MRRKTGCLALAVLLALTVCGGAAQADCQMKAASPAAAEEVAPLYCHGHGGRHGGHGHHGSAEACDWLFHACGECTDVNCLDENHAHRCPMDCTNPDHQHYPVCRCANGSLQLVQKKRV